VGARIVIGKTICGGIFSRFTAVEKYLIANKQDTDDIIKLNKQNADETI